MVLNERKGRFGQLGGRKKKQPPGKSQKGAGFFKWWTVPAILLAALIFFLSGTIGGDDFVYYESTVYESRIYNTNNGQVERSRKESFKSNIPSLVEQRSSSSLDTFMMEEDTNGMIRIEESIVDEFFE